MIVPSIDIQSGRAVQLRRGREFLFDGGDPLERLEAFATAGEVAIVDLDAAFGQGSNRDLIRRLVARHPCRVGGGIRTIEQALDWLDAGASKIVIGTAASPEFCAALPRERLIAAIDAEEGRVVVDGWRRATGGTPLAAIAQLGPHVGGFLFTQVEREGGMAGFDASTVAAVAEAAAPFGARVTAAGGITTAREVADLDAAGVDAQVGVALYRDALPLGTAIAAPLRGEGPWPTVVCDPAGRALGLVWSTRESIALAVGERRGIYWSRSRRSLWRKGESSGAVQDLVRIDLDCDRDALRFVVRQHGAGFCHRGSPSCWSQDPFGLADLDERIAQRAGTPSDTPADDDSGTRSLLADPELLASKLREEAAELIDATDTAEVVGEASDLLYFTLVRLRGAGAALADVERELARRALRVRRRPMSAKSEESS
jgi:phosphoribosyl-AMP cyclohydrolase / phosphoribosyl-ATP pyrophosphohydrolase